MKEEREYETGLLAGPKTVAGISFVGIKDCMYLIDRDRQQLLAGSLLVGTSGLEE